jgi:hypothetical protein
VSQQVWPSALRSETLRITTGLRHLGIVLPALINYGFLLLNGGRPHWAPVTLSLGAVGIPLVFLANRGDSKDAVWVGVLFFVFNGWPLVATALGVSVF